MSKPSRVDHRGFKYYLLIKKNDKWNIKQQSFVLFEYGDDCVQGQFISSLWFNEVFSKDKIIEFYIICVDYTFNKKDLMDNVSVHTDITWIENIKGVKKYEHFKLIQYFAHKMYDRVMESNDSQTIVIFGTKNDSNTLKFNLIKSKNNDVGNMNNFDKNEYIINYYNPAFKLVE